jgi:branched-chain amino acid aminotransferase
VKVWLNGALVDAESGCISPSDHGLLVGDGVFETLRCYAGVPFALADHLARLEAGARALWLEPPEREQLAAGAGAVIEANGLGDARMRITLTSGAGPPGLARGEREPTVLVSALPLTPWPPTATAIFSRWRRDEHDPLAGVKTVSLVGSVMALVEARSQGASDSILLNHAGNVCEATTANVFAIQAGEVTTPSLASGCLPGITRDRVLALCADLGIGAAEAELSASALVEADELFLTSSTREIQPLVEVAGRPVGTGGAGELTTRIALAYSDMVERELQAAQADVQ